MTQSEKRKTSIEIERKNENSFEMSRHFRYESQQRVKSESEQKDFSLDDNQRGEAHFPDRRF